MPGATMLDTGIENLLDFRRSGPAGGRVIMEWAFEKGPMESHSTRISLLVRVRDAADDAAWHEFQHRYGELILRYALTQGLQLCDAEDVRQNVLIRLARYLRSFDYQQNRGRFRDYLGAVVRNCVRTWRKRPVDRAAEVQMEEVEDRIGVDEPDPEWQREWMNHHYRLAMETLRRTVEPRSIEIFEGLIAGESTEAVAERLAMTTEAVRKVRQRIRARMAELVAAQIAEED